MVEQFTRRTVRQEGGIQPDEWIRRYIIGGALSGEEPVNVIRANGKTETVPRREAAIVFSDLETKREERRGNRGGAPAVTATPQVSLVHLVDGMRATCGLEPKFVNGEVKRRDVVIPLGRPTSSADHAVFLQCAREWVSAGANDIQSTDQEVANMFMSALQSMVWAISNDVSQKVQCKRFEALILFADTIAAYFARYPDAFKVIEPLRDADRARDSLQRALAFIFFEEPWSKEEGWRLLEIMLKRHRRHNQPNPPDFVTQPIAGIIGCLILVPLLHRLIHRQLTVSTAVKDANEKTEQLVQLMCDHIRDVDVDKRNKIILFKLAESCEKLDFRMDMKKGDGDDSTGKLYDFCMDMKNYDELAPFHTWGLVPIVTPPFNVICTGFTINGNKSHTVVKVKRKEKEGGPDRYEISPSAPSDWNAFGLSTEGEYKLRALVMGAAEQAKGNSLGMVNAANLRFTSGMEILPTDREGKSSAGMHHCQNRYGRFGYEKTGKTLNLGSDEKDIIITIRNGTCTVAQNGPFFTFSTGGDPVLIGFKNLKFLIQFTPAADPLHTDDRKDDGKIAGEAIGDVTGAALMAKLRELAVNEKGKTPQ